MLMSTSSAADVVAVVATPVGGPPPSSASRGPPAHLTFAACCLVMFVTVIFLHNHNSMAYVHSTIQYSLEAPAGWLQSRTTVHALTVTATTTTTTVAAAAAEGTAGNAAVDIQQQPASSRWRHRANMLTASTWDQQLPNLAAQPEAASAETSLLLPPAERDIELHPQRVAQVVQQARAAEEEQQQEGAAEGVTSQVETSAEKYDELYDQGAAGTVVFKQPQGDLSSCPEGTTSPQGATALVLLTAASRDTAVLKHSVDSLLLLYSQASADVRSAFHLYIGLDGGGSGGDSTDSVLHLGQRYAEEVLGTVKLVHSTPSNSSSSSQGGGAASDHVRLMLHVFLECLKYPAVLLLDDGMELLPDLLDFFDATHWLLASDPTLYCISAWNPLGVAQPHQQQQLARLARVDTHPAKGLLLERATGLQLLKSWPEGQQQHSDSVAVDWQQHVRNMGLQQGRQCVVPDVSRMQPAAMTAFSGTGGTSTASDASDAAAPDAVADAVDGQRAEDSAPNAASSNTGGSSSDVDTAEPDSLLQFKSDLIEGGVMSEAGPDGGVVDEEAAEGPEVVASNLAAPADAADTPHATDSAAAGQSAAPGQQQLVRSVWQGRDVSHMLEANYGHWLHQCLLAARAVDATTAAQLTSPHTALRVTYTTAAELTTVGKTLGLELTLTLGQRYCYSLPTIPPTQHCQDYLPRMAYAGIIQARTARGVRVYLVHTAFMTALEAAQTTSNAPTPTNSDAGRQAEAMTAVV